jgi:catechol 2,3-dioxygenase-like lactoylglutathione lyase family enzyme
MAEPSIIETAFVMTIVLKTSRCGLAHNPQGIRVSDAIAWVHQILELVETEERTVLDHIYISVSDVPRSLTFYAATLEPLGWRELGTYDSSTGPAEVPDLYGLADEAYGSGVAVGSSIWLRHRHFGETGLYVGFVADDESEVNAAYAAAIEAGGSSEGEPALRAYFGPSYYAANIADFDGNHLEIVHKSFNPPSRQHLV